MKDILRAGVAVPELRVADISYNLMELGGQIGEAHKNGVKVLAFPELCITGYTCGDLFLSDLLLSRAEEALALLAGTVPADMLVAVGAPLRIGTQVYNCGVVLSGGRILGAVPKTYLPNHAEFSEKRWFSSAKDLGTGLVTVGSDTFPVGSDLLFRAPDGTVVALELCEDLFAPLPPSTLLALAGAEVILNLSASNETVGKRAFRRDCVLGQSTRTLSAYLYASAGFHESTADLVFSGHGMIALAGKLLAENKKRIDSNYLLFSDIDLGKIRFDRRHIRTFGEAASDYTDSEDFRTVDVPTPLAVSDGSALTVGRLPFIPEEKNARTERCMQIFEMQVAALTERLRITGGKAVIGISGGLDSTLTLLVAIRAMEKLRLPRTNITALTLPCFGTSGETLQNALTLMENLGVTSRTISIESAVLGHFRDIGHDPADFSVTYENAQARERTQVLMDVANQVGGIVLGTGDLSESALGWCTFNADHMSMYNVNCDIPKTLVRWIITAIADENDMPEVTDVLYRVLDTPISPELLPPDAVGKISQKTEDLVGPYALHDFFLYYAVRYEYSPEKIFELAVLAFREHFDKATIKKWLTVFYRRFFTQQFKRNCVPDGVKVGSVCLSPRGDWKMPSDASVREWLREIENIEA